jgi:alpha-1,6-mannosyltransferase
VFRGDTAILFASILLFLLLTRKISFFQTVIDGFVATLGSLVLTVLVDSWFWQRWLWPEGEVLYFNTILNKSHEWGVHPPFWYFYSALPRALLLTALLIPFGVSSLLPALFKARNLKQIKECFAVAPLLDASVCTFVVPVRTSYCMLRCHSFSHRFLSTGTGVFIAILYLTS